MIPLCLSLTNSLTCIMVLCVVVSPHLLELKYLNMDIIVYFFWYSDISFVFILNQIRVRVEKDPELGFSISGGVGGRGNPFRPDDDVSFFLKKIILLYIHNVSFINLILNEWKSNVNFLGLSSLFFLYYLCFSNLFISRCLK